MIYLYSLPGVNLTYPEITNPMIKGNLNTNDLKSKHVDMTLDFLLHLRKDEDFNRLYNQIKQEDLLFGDRLRCNEEISLFIKTFFNKYNIDYIKKAMVIKKDINTVDKLLSFLNEDNIELKVFDEIFDVSSFKDNDYLYINIAYNFQLPYALKFAKLVKKSVNVKVIIGGNYITHIKDNMLDIIKKFEFIDAVFYYAEYDSLYKIIKYYDDNKDVDCDCLIRLNGKVKEYVNLNIKTDDISIPDFSDLKLEEYLSFKNVVPMLISKGCYYNKCNFCAHHYFYKCRQLLNIEKICECVKKLVENNNVNGIIFVDECINFKDILHFATYLVENKIKVNWLMETRISKEYLNDRNCELLEKSGCKLITFGVESASQRVLNLMNKGIKFKDAKKVLEKLYSYNIIISSTYMIGYPGERNYEINKTLRFLKKFKCLDGFGINQFNFVRNSRIATISNVNVKDTMDLSYSYVGQRKDYLHKKILNFYSNEKIKRYKMIRDKTLNRSDYLFLKKSDVSLNKICNKEVL